MKLFRKRSLIRVVTLMMLLALLPLSSIVAFAADDYIPDGPSVYAVLPPVTITYYSGNDDANVSPIKVIYAVGALALIIDKPGDFTKTGYTFKGWNTKADGSGLSYDSGKWLTIRTDMNLYPVWDKAAAS